VSDGVEPVGHRLTPADSGGPLREGEKGGLERIFGGRAIPKDSPTHPEDQVPVAADQFGEGFLVPTGDEPPEEVPV
jgi:hypothetical protein